MAKLKTDTLRLNLKLSIQKMEEFQQLSFWSNPNPKPGKEKIHFSFGGSKEHFTIHFGMNPFSIGPDLHRTDENYPEGDPRRHNTLFQISHFALKRVIVKTRHAAPKLLSWVLKHKVIPGLLKKKHIWLLPVEKPEGLLCISYEEKRNRRKYKLKNAPDENVLIENLLCPYCAIGCDSQIFLAMSNRYGFLRYKGVIYRFQDARGQVGLFFVDPVKMMKVMKEFVGEFSL